MAATETVRPPAVTASSHRTTGLLIGLGSAAAFGLSGSFGHALLDLGWSPTALVAARVGGAFLVLLIPCLLLLRRTGLPNLRQSGRVVVYGVVAVAGCQLFYFSSLQHLSVGVALLLEYLAPVALIGWRWSRGERPSAAVLAGAGLALVGLALVLDVTHGFTVSGVGVAYGLAAMLCLAAYFVLSESRADASELPPLVLLTGGTGVGVVVLLAVGGLGLLPLTVGFGTADLGGRELPWWAPMALLVLVSAVLAYLTGIMAVRRLGGPVASFVALTEVLFAIVFAAVLVSQIPTGGQLLGALLVLVGVVVVQGGSATAPPWAAGRLLYRAALGRFRSTIRR
ncbi:EamA family transporter [Microlunatus spumicola]|uniref:EamA family transporter n=1 Tax=Microlunatus spumicola TaxID=81499 RepID=A0ABP6XI30_9ACTN